MRIIKQDSFNECGICCVNMLINYYNNSDTDIKSELLRKCNLTKEGLNLWELEKLCENYKIEVDSYEASYDELIEIKSKNPLILILKSDYGLHYVIGLIYKKDKIKIYDPSGEIYVVNNAKEFTAWTGYVCLTKTIKFRFKPIDITLPLIKNLNIMLIIMLLILNLIEFGLSIAISWLMSKIINLDLSNISIDSLWKLGIIFITLIFVNACFNFINDFLKLVYSRKNNKFFINQFLEQFQNKNYYFYECYSKEQIMQHYQLSQQLISFYNFFWSDLIAQVILLFSTTTFLILINSSILVMICINIALKIILIFCYLKIDLKLQNKIISKQALADKKFYEFLNLKEYSYFYKYEQMLMWKINEDLTHVYEYKYNNEYKKYLLDFCSNIWQYFFNFVILIFLWKNQSFNLGILFLCYSLFNIFNDSLEQVLKTIKQFLQVKPIYKYLLKMFNTNIIKTNSGIILDTPLELKWDNLVLKKNCYIEINNLVDHQMIKSLLIHQSEPINLFINNQNIKNYDSKDLIKKIILIDDNFNLSSDETILALKELKNKIDEYPSINWSNFNFNKIPKDIRIALILIYLSNCKNSIICFNNLFHNVSKKFSCFYYEKLIKLNESNFIISNSISNELNNFYDYQI